MKRITAAEFPQEVLEAKTPVLVDFYTADCRPCQQMAPMVEEVETQSGGALKVVKVDASAEPEFTAGFRIATVPSFVLFKQGIAIGQTSGSQTKPAMEAWIKRTLGER